MADEATYVHRLPSVQPAVPFAAAAFRVMDALRGFSDGTDEAFCTKAQLAKQMEACMSTVDFGVRELHRAGALEIVPQYDENGSQMGNVYRILADIGLYTERRGRPRKHRPAEQPEG